MFNVQRLLIGAVCCLLLLPASHSRGEAVAQRPTVSHHALSVELRPDSHELIVTDRMTIGVPDGLQVLSFSLAQSLRVEGITAIDPDASRGGRSHQDVFFQRDMTDDDRVTIHLADHRPVWTLEWRYRGVINDPPREPRHLRFVTPSETSGHIGPGGVYLSSESKWYPDLAGSLAAYDMRVSVPPGWTSVSQGEDPAESGHWSSTTPSEALTLVANRFAVASREWKASNGQTIRLSTYLFPDDAHLAAEYLDASARYLDAYIPLLGSYPFGKFAVVENFFSSGLGMPSFTLLGAAVIKRHYTQPYALGHEIVHSWIGNGVYNRLDHGNWVEGLTTYLANYYYHELVGDEAQAREQRRLMLFGYAVYVRPDQDYPISGFMQKTDEKDNAIGYQKTAMVFHMLRREVGDAAFWAALKDLTAQRIGAYADWADIEAMFGARHGRDLRWFFAQWVERPGAPRVTVADATVRQIDTSATGTSVLSVTLHQHDATYRVPIDVRFRPASQGVDVAHVELTGPEQSFTVPVSEPARMLEIDPDFHLFRRLERHELPPMLNLFVTDARRTIRLAEKDADNQSLFAAIVKRVQHQEAQKPESGRSTISESGGLAPIENAGSILLLGSDQQVASMIQKSCGDTVHIAAGGFTVKGITYEGPDLALLVSCRRSDVPGSVISLLHGVTPASLSTVARLLFFYGWNSYVVFKGGTVLARGDWEMDTEREVILE
jgi:hypothetical protein